MKEIYSNTFNNPEFDPKPTIWVKDFDIDAAEIFIRTLNEYESNENIKEIFVYILSYGGEVPALIAMVDSIQNCIKPINTIAIGTADSCGAVLFTSGTGERYISKNSTLHIHYLRGDVSGDLEEIKQTNKQYTRADKKMFEVLAKQSGKTITDIKKKLKEENREWNLSAKEALEWGFATKIGLPKLTSYLTVKCE